MILTKGLFLSKERIRIILAVVGTNLHEPITILKKLQENAYVSSRQGVNTIKSSSSWNIGKPSSGKSSSWYVGKPSSGNSSSWNTCKPSSGFFSSWCEDKSCCKRSNSWNERKPSRQRDNSWN